MNVFRTFLVCLILAFMVSNQGCSTPPVATEPVATATAVPQEPSVLRFAIAEDPRSLEPGLTVMILDSQIALNLHAGLFAYDVDSRLVPYLVETWDVSDDSTVYTFHLRDDARWHNGRSVSADDFKKGWERTLDPALSGWGAGYLQSIAGAKEIINGKATDLRGVEVIDSNTLKVTLVQPDPVFLLRLATTPAWIVPPEAVAEGQPIWKDMPIGGGPFEFVEWESKVRLVLKANPGFFRGRPQLDRIEYLVVPDPATALNMYLTNQVDIVEVPASELERIGQDVKLSEELHFWTKAQLAFLGLNMHKVEAFRDVRVRQAFVHAIDREQIIDKVLFGAWSPATGFVPPNVPGHDPSLGYPYDPDKARSLLDEAGYTNGGGFPSLELVAPASTEIRAAEAVAAQLRTNLGIEIEVFQPEPGAFYEGLWSHDKWDMFLAGWTADYPSAEQWLYNLMYSGLDSNFTGYANETYKDIVDRAMKSLDDTERTALWQQANQMATDDVAMIPLGYGQFIYLVKPNVAGFGCTVFEPMGFEEVSKK